MKKTAKLFAFTLAEMLVVLLIVTIIMAASLPIITVKTRSKAGMQLWHLATNGIDIFFGGEPEGVSIGMKDFTDKAKLQINTNPPSIDKPNPSHIIFNEGGVTYDRLKVTSQGLLMGLNSNINSRLYDPLKFKNNLAIGLNSTIEGPTDPDYVSQGPSGSEFQTYDGNNIAIGAESTILGASRNIAIGPNSKITLGIHSVAIGSYSQANGAGSTSVGWGALANEESTAVGPGAKANGYYATAIGTEAKAESAGTIAIGDASSAKARNTIAIGTKACAGATGANKICIGAHSGPPSNSIQATDNVERIYIGSASKYNSKDAVLEVHNPTPETKELSSSPGTSAVVVNGNLVVNGRIYLETKSEQYQHSLRIISGTSGGLTADYGSPTYLVNSDRRLKNVKKENNSGLEQIKKLKIYDYTFKKDKEKTPHVGIMAQDLKKIFPDAVKKGDNGFLVIRQEDMFYAMINAIKQLDKMVQAVISKVNLIESKLALLNNDNKYSFNKIKELEAKNKKLEAQNKVFEARLKRLEKLAK